MKKVVSYPLYKVSCYVYAKDKKEAIESATNYSKLYIHKAKVVKKNFIKVEEKED
jgi:hypothetical protein